MQRHKGRILPLENERHSGAQLARQRTKQEQSCFLHQSPMPLNQPSTGTKAPQSSLALWALPVTNQDDEGFPRRPRGLSQETTAQLTVVPASPSTFGASALQGKSALGSTFHHHFWIFPGTRFDGHQLMPKHPSPAADTLALGRWGGQQHHPVIHEFSKRIHWWKLKALCKVRLWSTVGEGVQMFSCSFTKLHHVTINCESASFTWAARGLPPRLSTEITLGRGVQTSQVDQMTSLCQCLRLARLLERAIPTYGMI